VSEKVERGARPHILLQIKKLIDMSRLLVDP
jgi:hypothetical protein